VIRHILVSDTHGQNNLLRTIPEGDVLIHCGDATRYGSRKDLKEFVKIFGAADHKTKIMIAGNHDACFVRHPEEARAIVAEAGIIYLEDEGVKINGLRYWGVPWVPLYGPWVFMGNEQLLAEKWAMVDVDTDVVISHGPPQYIRDGGYGSISHGDIVALVVQPQLNVFGHIHNGYGILVDERITYVNCSLLNDDYEPTNRPVIHDLPTV
jgi:calcineurin-like phosphoesterase family protein